MAPCQSIPSSSSSSLRFRRTRIVCVADTHNCTLKLPKGDVLIHAGDMTNKGTYPELSRTVQWLEKADFEVKIVVAGNHDVTLDREFYQQHGARVHNNMPPQCPERCLALLTSDSPSITYLCHGSATMSLGGGARGPPTTFKVFGSPYSPHMGGDDWAFGYERSPPPPPSSSAAECRPASRGQQPAPATATARALWSSIPLDADIVVTHTPPHLHRDESTSRRRALGCEELRRALWRVRPRLAVCGHVHEARGAERIMWDMAGARGSANVAYGEAGTETWEDSSSSSSSSRRISLVDLTGRGGKRALDNDGSHPALAEAVDHASIDYTDICDGGDSGDARGGCGGGDGAGGGDSREAWPGVGIGGLGGDPETSVRCDREALRGRMGRRETCVVNCAIMANSYPHFGGKKFNKPIVVDVDLPAWVEKQQQ